MLIFIDESGCAGFKFAKGSSRFFVVSMVIFASEEDAMQVSRKIGELHIPLSHKPEFKFSSCRNDVKDEFFQAMRIEPFTVRTIVIDKSKLYSSHLRSQKDSFYNYFVQLLLKHDNGMLDQASIKIDGSGDREFKKALAAYLRQQIGSGKIKRFKFEDSKKNNLIQLADMTAGAIARAYNRKDHKNSSKWFEQLKPKIQDLWDFG